MLGFHLVVPILWAFLSTVLARMAAFAAYVDVVVILAMLWTDCLFRRIRSQVGFLAADVTMKIRRSFTEQAHKRCHQWEVAFVTASTMLLGALCTCLPLTRSSAVTS